MAKVYVSSTIDDLQKCRRQVSIALRQMGHEDVAMEYYTARDQRPVDKCLDDVAACDLYVGIFAWHYGTIPPDDNPGRLSITEMEYRQAKRSDKKCFIFLLHEDAPWLRKFIDRDPQRIDDLRNDLRKNNICSFFKSDEDIAGVVGPAVYNWAKEHGHIPHEKSPLEFDLNSYHSALKNRYQHIDLEVLTPMKRKERLRWHLRSIFVEQSVREEAPPVELAREDWERLRQEKEIHSEGLPYKKANDGIPQSRVYNEKPLRPVLDVLIDPRHKKSIILGNPGSGKSTLARYVVLSLIDSAINEKLHGAFPRCLPVLIDLRSYAGLVAGDKCSTFREFLEYLDKPEGWHLTANALRQHLKNHGQAVIIFDGLDEIFNFEDRNRITRQIVGFSSDYPEAHIIVTSRILGYQSKILSDADFSHFRLQDLDEAQVATFINRWYDLALSDRRDEAKEKRERLLRSFIESASIRQLAGNPILLTIMVIIGKHQELPRERWKLYDHAASVLIERWDVNKHLEDRRIQADLIGEEEKKEMLRRLAFQMQSSAVGLAGNYIHREDLQDVFEGYLKERFQLTPDRLTTIAREIINQLHERNFILSLFGANLYGFVHRAFLEYFCASAFINKIKTTREMKMLELKRDVYGTRWEDHSWHEVLRLICGMMDGKFSGEIIDSLIEAADQPRPDEYKHRPPWNIALAVQCLGEMRNLDTVAETARRLLKIVCSLFEYIDKDRPELVKFLEEQIAASAEIVGTNWPHRALLADWLNDLNPNENAGLYKKAFGKLTASIGAGQKEIHRAILDYATHSDKWLRLLAPVALAKGWRDDSETLPMLIALASSDIDEDVRRASVSALAQHFRDNEQTLPLLLNRASIDPNEDIRRDSISILVQHFRDNEQALSLLLDRASNDNNEWVRRASVSALAQHFRDNEQTLPLLLNRASIDPNEDIRRDSISILVQHFRDNEQTLPLLLDRAYNDASGWVRRDSISILAQHFLDDEQTLPLLLNRASNDENEWVRHDAVSALAQHFSNDRRALAMLIAHASNEASERARSDSLTTLAQHFRNDKKTLYLLLDRASNDPDEGIRRESISLIARHFCDNKRTLPSLIDRAVNDLDEDVRRLSVEALIRCFRKNRQILPLLLKLAQGEHEASEFTRIDVVRKLVRWWQDHPKILPLIDSLSGESNSESLREIAKNAAISIRNHRRLRRDLNKHAQ